MPTSLGKKEAESTWAIELEPKVSRLRKKLIQMGSDRVDPTTRFDGSIKPRSHVNDLLPDPGLINDWIEQRGCQDWCKE